MDCINNITLICHQGDQNKITNAVIIGEIKRKSPMLLSSGRSKANRQCCYHRGDQQKITDQCCYNQGDQRQIANVVIIGEINRKSLTNAVIIREIKRKSPMLLSSGRSKENHQ
jgi:hypothetical protein